MKTWSLIGVFLLMSFSTLAQNNRKARPAGSVKSAVALSRSETITLKHEGVYKTYAAPVKGDTGLYISDAVVNLMRANAGGAGIEFNNTGLVGVPRGTYGFANGRILLYVSGATSSGTTTGSGSVGTGSSPAAVGSFGPATGTNGKSPYSGNGPYADRIPPFGDMLESKNPGQQQKQKNTTNE